MNIEQFTENIYDAHTATVAREGIEALLDSHRQKLQQAEAKYGAANPRVWEELDGVSESRSKADESSRAREFSCPWDEGDVFVITYGDTFLPGNAPLNKQEKAEAGLGLGGGIEQDGRILPLTSEQERSLRTLRRFAQRYLHGVVSGIHILPFFPYSSDDGFSIVDYFTVNPLLGNWDDVRALADSFRFMADLVLNHCSAKGPWLKGYLSGDPRYENYFISLPPETDLSSVVRPRTHPLLSEFRYTGESAGKAGAGSAGASGAGNAGKALYLWTTFSADQVDLNFASPNVLVVMLEALLFFIENGSQVIRLDAIAYLWKELGTPSIHHEKTHLVVQLFRHILNEVAPWVILITETNVPHAENISYFGNGTNEAHIIYQFSLPPLILDAFLRGDARHLSDWAETIPSGEAGKIGYECTYFNFCASHDGIGVTPAHGILSEDELKYLCESVLDRGGRINYKNTPQGKIPYELNINYFSAIAEASLPEELRIQKFLASQAILLSFVGIPGIYIHSLIGSENWQEGVELTGANRTINRQKIHLSELEAELESELRQTSAAENNQSTRAKIYSGYTDMIVKRRRHPAFHPAGRQTVLKTSAKEVLCLLREAPQFAQQFAQAAEPAPKSILCLINTSGSHVHMRLSEFHSQSLRSRHSQSLPHTHQQKLNPPALYDILSETSIAIETTEASRATELSAVNISKTSKHQTISLKPWGVLWLEV